MPAALPITIPFCAVNLSYQETLERNVASFKPAVGRPKERMRSSIPDSLIKFSRTMTIEQWAALKNFYLTTVKNGVLEFTAKHPLYADTDYSSRTGTFLFTDAPAMQPIGSGKLMVSISLRQIA